MEEILAADGYCDVKFCVCAANAEDALLAASSFLSMVFASPWPFANRPRSCVPREICQVCGLLLLSFRQLTYFCIILYRVRLGALITAVLAIVFRQSGRTGAPWPPALCEEGRHPAHHGRRHRRDPVFSGALPQGRSEFEHTHTRGPSLISDKSTPCVPAGEIGRQRVAAFLRVAEHSSAGCIAPFSESNLAPFSADSARAAITRECMD